MPVGSPLFGLVGVSGSATGCVLKWSAPTHFLLLLQCTSSYPLDVHHVELSVYTSEARRVQRPLHVSPSELYNHGCMPLPLLLHQQSCQRAIGIMWLLAGSHCFTPCVDEHTQT